MASSSDTAVPPSRSDRRVLLVQADHEMRERYVACLREAGFRVVEAENGQQALEAAARTLPDLIVADLDMPSIDGLAFCRRLRGEPSREEVILVTLESRRAGAPDAGAEEENETRLAKPCPPARLLAEILHLVQVADKKHRRAATRRAGELSGRVVDAELLARVRAEFTDLPSLKLTLEQAERLWQHHAPEIDAVFQVLVDEGYLQRTPDARYARAGSPQAARPRVRMIKAGLDAAPRAPRARRPDGTGA